jgi:hypothetical protein
MARSAWSASDETANIESSEQARVFEATWTGDNAPSHGFDVVAVAPTGEMIYLYVNSSEADWDEERFRAIVDSLEVSEVDAEQLEG